MKFNPFTSPNAGRGSSGRSFASLLTGISAAYLLLQLPFLDRVPAVVVDEPWYAGTAHNLANGDGLINTNVGSMGGDRFFLYPLIVAGAFEVLGTSLFSGRLMSVLLGLIAVWGWALLCRKLNFHGWLFVLTATLLVTSNIYFILFRRLRPEVLVIALSIWSLCFFIEAWQTLRFDAGFACALLVGASILAHPNGTLLSALFALFLVARGVYCRHLRVILGYALGSLIIFSLLLIGWHFLASKSPWHFLEPLLESRRLSLTHTSVFAAFWANVAMFVPAYSLGVKRLYILIFEIGVLIAGLTVHRRDPLTALLAGVGLVWFVMGLFFLTPFFRWAFGFVVLFSLAVTGRLLGQSIADASPAKIKALWVLVLFYGLNTLAGTIYAVRIHVANTPYTSVSKALEGRVPANVSVATHLELWFPFQRNCVYTQFQRWAATPYASLLDLLGSGEIRYAVLSSAFTRGVSPTTGEQERLYRDVSSGRFYEQVHAYAVAHGERVAVVPTRGYGEIEIWEIPPNPDAKLALSQGGKCGPHFHRGPS